MSADTVKALKECERHGAVNAAGFCDTCKESEKTLKPLIEELKALRLTCKQRQIDALERGETRLLRHEYATDNERVHLLETLLASDLSLYARLYEHTVAFATGVRVDPLAYDGGRVTGTRGYKSETSVDDFSFIDTPEDDDDTPDGADETDSLDALILLAEYELKSIVENERWRNAEMLAKSEAIAEQVENVENMMTEGLMSASTGNPLLGDLWEEFERLENERVLLTPALRLSEARTKGNGLVSHTNAGMTKFEIIATTEALIERVRKYGLRPITPRARVARAEPEAADSPVWVRRATEAEIEAIRAAKIEQLPISYRRTSTVKFLTGNPNGIVQKSQFDRNRETETKATVRRATSMAAKMRKRMEITRPARACH